MGRRAEVTKSVHVARPQEQVFDYLVDFSRHGEWSPKPWRAEGLDGPVAAGTRFASYGLLPGSKKEHRNDIEMNVVERPSRIVFTATEKGEQFVNTFTLTPDGDGTKVERHVDLPVPGGLLGVMFPLISSMVISPGVAKNLGMFKERAEAL